MSNNRVPINYIIPAFPSLYDPLSTTHDTHVSYLYYTQDIWRFTLYWTFIFYAATHLPVAACAVVMQCRSWKTGWAIPVIYAVVGGLQALIAGSIVGLVLGAVYESGNFRMSTWLPMIWGGVNVMVLVLTSFPTQGGL